MKPYKERVLNENIVLRGFSEKIMQKDLVWHRDAENRTIIVVEGSGWGFQRDDNLPRNISVGEKIDIRANEYHRLVKGDTDLVVAIIKEGCWKGYTQKGMKKKGKREVPNCVPVSESDADGMKSVKKGADNNPKITKMDFLPSKVLDKIAKEKNLDEGDTNSLVCPKCGTHNSEGIDKCRNCGHPYPNKYPDKESGKAWEEIASEGKRRKAPKKDRKNPKQYSAPQGSARDKGLDKAAELYAKGDVKGAAKVRKAMEEPHMAESLTISNEALDILIDDAIEEEKLDNFLNEIEEKLDEKKRKKRKKKGGGLSAAVKKSLDKKADKRCLTRGSVYSEFRKGLAAFLSSGSRKGMSAHQWAHARVNSAQPSKKWATVKKRKKCPKKK